MDIWLTLTALIFLLSRAILWIILGVRYDASSLIWAWQLLDPLWLRKDLLTSLWNMHMQPPLFNLLTAVALRFPSPSHLLAPLFFAMGMGTSLLLYGVGVRSGLSRPLSFAVVSLVFTFNPSSFLYETWYFYTYPSLFLTVLLSYLLLRLNDGLTVRRLLPPFIALTLLTLLRSSYHLLLFPLLGGVLLWHHRRRWRIIFAVVLLTSLPTAAWYLKNFALFGNFSATSWTGMNLSRLIWNMPGWERETFLKLHEEGVVSALMTVPPFSPPETYASLLNWSGSTGVAVLDSMREPTTGSPNYNHAVYPKVSRILLRDNLNLVLRFPLAYLRAILSSLKHFTYPPYAYPLTGRFHLLFDRENLKRIYGLRLLIRLYDALYGWLGRKLPGITTLLLLLAFLLLLPGMIRRRDVAPVAVLLLYLLVVHVALERKENMRFKFQFEGVITTVVLANFLKRRR
ncbi:MAG: hypothetical protein GXO29_02485 [Thermotogae bacterium]|nr:hypothetical protein [Thermotogota bacterium]